MKRLAVNADDFGFTADVNAGIVYAHREGILTSTTLMANGEAFDDAVRLASENPRLDIGCHLVLVQGRSLLNGHPFADDLSGVLQRWIAGRLNAYAELRAQIEKILAAGIRPTHLDSHKHTHLLPGVYQDVVRLAAEFDIPWVRLPLDRTTRRIGPALVRLDPFYRTIAKRGNVRVTDRFVGFRLTGTLDEQSLLREVDRVEDGTTELMCHPGFLRSELASAATRLKETRVRELEALTSPRVREMISAKSIRLATFADLAQN